MKHVAGVSISGEFRLIASKDAECTEITRDSGFFSNMVLDNGFDLACTQGIFAGSTGSLREICVGVGSGAPTPGQTSLVDLRASTSIASATWTASDESGYIQMRISRQFPSGAVSGNLTEVGVGYSPTNLFSRALIVDSEGNPTTFTVFGSETLTVVYILRIYYPSSDFVQEITAYINGVPTTTTVTMRPCLANTMIATGGNGIAFGASSPSVGSWTGNTTYTSLQPRSASPAASGSGVTVAIKPYVTGSASREFDINFGTGGGSGTTHVFTAAIGPMAWQYHFNPPVTKTPQEIMTLTVGYQYARPE